MNIVCHQCVYVVVIMNVSYFDESIFLDCYFYKTLDNVSVSNKVDRFLLERNNISIVDSINAIRVNGNDSTKGVNIYSIWLPDVPPLLPYVSKRPFNEIKVENRKSILVSLSEPIHWANYTYNNSFTPLENALLVKFYAMNKTISVTPLLYINIVEYFERDCRDWFNINGSTRQNKNNEIIKYNQAQIPLDHLYIETPPVWQ